MEEVICYFDCLKVFICIVFVWENFLDIVKYVYIEMRNIGCLFKKRMIDEKLFFECFC